jgi:PilZ domain-containing protein
MGFILAPCSSTRPSPSHQQGEDASMPSGMSGSEHYERGLLLKKAQIFESALKEFQQATLDPQQAGKAFAQVALCLKTLGRDEEAVTALRQALGAGSFSSKERLHIRYLLGQTLESLGREFEALVVYRRIRREDQNFQDVDARIQQLSSDQLRLVSSDQLASPLTGDVAQLEGQLKSQFASLLSRTWHTLARYAEALDTNRWIISPSSGLRRKGNLEPTLTRSSSAPTEQSASAQKGQTDKRRHGRVTVQLLSQFSSKTPVVAGEGELRDLSPCGCRITSPVGVPLGAALECWIYPQDEHPFTVDEATVRWIGHREFGLAFTKVRPSVQRQIAQMCRKVAAH